MKIFLAVFVLSLTTSISYHVGVHKGHNFNKYNDCLQKVTVDIKKDDKLLELYRRLPFDISYHYLIGRSYECVLHNGVE